jgi:hypothetical protein
MSAPYVLLGGVNTVAATPPSEAHENIRENLKRGLPRLHDLPEWKKVKGKDAAFAIVGGGPSLKRTLDELRPFEGRMIVCGSAHDYLREQGFKPRYAAVCDPDPIMANYLRRPCPETTYLLSTHCHATAFSALEGMPIVLWHCAPIEEAFINEVDPGWQAVGGGCTVGLRAISIAMMMGYSNLHFFGFDSSIDEDNDHHAYGFSDKSEELGVIYTIKLGTTQDGPSENAREFRCAGYQMAQVSHFKILLEHYGTMFTPTFHGDGLLPTMWANIKCTSDRLDKEAKEQAA